MKIAEPSTPLPSPSPLPSSSHFSGHNPLDNGFPFPRNNAGGKGRKMRKLDHHVSNDDKASKFPNAKPLEKSDKTFMFVRHLFMSRINKVDPQAVVTEVHQFQVSASWFARTYWNAFQRQIEITNVDRAGQTNIVYGWYAATKEKVAYILSQGFNIPDNNSICFPVTVRFGVFFGSPRVTLSQCPVEEEGEKYIILCRLVLGSVEKVDIESNQIGPCRKEYDTGSDNPSDPNWYVVWNIDSHRRIFPDCVITCKTSAILPVEWKTLRTTEHCVIPRLVFGMKQRIPISDVRLLDAMYDYFKSGMVSRGAFLKQMKAYFGEALLQKTAMEIFKPFPITAASLMLG